jgi:SAM-dependent methyltransferase
MSETLPPRFYQELQSFERAMEGKSPRFALKAEWFHPCMEDATGRSDFDRHYVYHTAWAARRVGLHAPVRHVDISSFLYFSTLLSAFVPVDFYEFRPTDLVLEGLSVRHADLMALPFADASVHSLSCLHVVEHIGLGRYGDPIDPDGDLKAFAELRRVVAPGGVLLLALPCGFESRICFNAHRIYTHAQVLGMFEGFELTHCALVTDSLEHPHWLDRAGASDFDRQQYGCGCFEFRRPL